MHECLFFFFTSFLILIYCSTSGNILVADILHTIFFFILKERFRNLIYMNMEYDSFCHQPISDVVLYSMFLNLLQTFYQQYVFLPL